MTRVVLLAVVVLVVVYQVSGAPNHNGLLKEVKRNMFGERGYQSTKKDESHYLCNGALEQKREVVCQPDHGTDSPTTAGAMMKGEFVESREANKFLRRGIQNLWEECCSEGCYIEEIHEHCP